MNKLLYILTAFFFCNVAFAQSTNRTTTFTGDAGKDVAGMLPAGTHSVQTVDTITSTQKIELTPAGTVQILRNSNMITFKGEGKLDLLNAITVDVEKRTVAFGKYKMNITDTLTIQKGDAQVSPRKGYTWTYTDAKDITTVDFAKTDELNLTWLELEVCKLSDSGKTFLRFKGLQFINGLKTMNFELPIVF